MDIRVLRYFLTVAKEGNISSAAKVLHMSQPPLSRQLQELEKELGKKLLERGNREIKLTNDGIFLKKRAEEIITLFDKTKLEMLSSNEEISGDIYIGGGESAGMKLIAQVFKKMQAQYPKIHYHLYSGNFNAVKEQMDKGLLDFGVLLGPTNLSGLNYLKLPYKDTWGLLIPKNDVLSKKKFLRPNDLKDLPLLCSSQMLEENGISGWLGASYDTLNIIATYTLINTPAQLVLDGLGYALTFDNLVNTSISSDLCFRPLKPKLEAEMYIVWRKNQAFTSTANKFIELLYKEFEKN